MKVYLILIPTLVILSCDKENAVTHIRILNKTNVMIDKVSVSSIVSPDLERETLFFNDIPIDSTTGFESLDNFNITCPLLGVFTSVDTLKPVLEDCISIALTSPSTYTIVIYQNRTGQFYPDYREE